MRWRNVVAALPTASAIEECMNHISSRQQPLTALEIARSLQAPVATVQTGGEFEGADFWSEHEQLLERARLELGPRHAYVYAPSLRECFRTEIVSAIDDPNPGHALRLLTKQTEVEGVFELPLLREEFVADLMSEFNHLRASGIPLRRPNGMNREGLILSFLGFQNGFLASAFAKVMQPLGLELYPHALRSPDIAELYGFSIKYDADNDGDIFLAEHADAAALTFNICLGHEGFQGGELRFRGVRFHDPDADSRPAVAVSHAPGAAIIHLGQHLHSAAPLHSGVRENFVVWAMGRYGYVRIAPYNATDDRILKIF